MSVAASESAGAVRFVEWLVSSEGRASIEGANQEIFGTRVFVPPTGGTG